MKKLAIVVQRCHERVVGGSESLAWQYAVTLKDIYDVDLLTTTAVNISDWANELAPGIESREGVTIRRFEVTLGRSSFWGIHFDRLQDDLKRLDQHGNSRSDLPWRVQLQEEFIRHQGPYSKPLIKFLWEKWKEYHTTIFVTYLYPTTYFGILQIPPNRCLLVPTLHDEPAAYLPVFRHMARRARACMWLSEAERNLGQALWGEVPGSLVAMSVDCGPRKPAELRTPYLLFSGRIDQHKGCQKLFEYFIEFKKNYPSQLRLILTGQQEMTLPDHPDIEFLGHVPVERKFELMSGATLLMIPSRHESFSIVTLEAMAQGTPVLVEGGSEVLSDHVRQSGAGRVYVDYQTFAEALSEMLQDEERLKEMGNLGRSYVNSKYRPEHIKNSLIAAVESLP